ncbi:MAG: IS1595 family transposase [Hyphomonadaceae bacterium]|nr:IS1595 family transposase [Hyphomonadaceae bacterium]
MAQHFLLQRQAKSLSIAQVCAMSDAQAEMTFRHLRWPETEGAPVCPRCGCLDAYETRRPTGLLMFRCKGCNKNFSITSGTLFASRKMTFKQYLLAIALFCNEVKGKSMLALSRDLGSTYRTSFVLAHKLRESMAAEMKGREIGGPGIIAETDGAAFGGHVRPANFRENRRDRRLAANQSGKRKWVVIVRERGGKTLPGVFSSEGQAIGFIKQRVKRETILHADEAGSWNALHERYQVHRINHQEAYSDGQACTNAAESFFSRMRRGEIGHHHHVAGPYLLRFAQEAAWREDNRRVSNGDQVKRVAALALSSKPSVDFTGYTQRHKA